MSQVLRLWAFQYALQNILSIHHVLVTAFSPKLIFFILEEMGQYKIIADCNSSTIVFNFFSAVHNLSLKKTKLGTRVYFCVCRMTWYGPITLISADIDLLLPHLHTTHASLPYSIIFAKKFLLPLTRFLGFILPLDLQSVLTGPILQMSVFHNGLTEFSLL